MIYCVLKPQQPDKSKIASLCKWNFSDLVERLSSPSPCGLTMKPWGLESVVQVKTHKLMSTLLRQLASVIFRKDMYCEHCFLTGIVIGDSKGPGPVCECSVDFT